MIDAKFTYDKRFSRVQLELRGHAASAPKGEDLICAGVSALAVTAAQMAKNLYREEMLRRSPRILMEPGYCLVVAVIQKGFEAEALMAFWTVQVGIHALAEEYPDYVNLEEVLQV